MEYVARPFGEKMGAKCLSVLSIEAAHDFAGEIKRRDAIAICYPIYGSRVPRIMRKFARQHISQGAYM